MQTKILLVCFSICVLSLLPGIGHPNTGVRQAVFERPAPADSALLGLKDQGATLFRAGRYLQAEAIYEQGYRMAVAQGQPGLAIRFLNNLGSCRFATSRLRRAMNDYLEARRLAEEARDFGMVGALSSNIASLYLHLREFEASRAAAEQGLAAIRGQGQPEYHAKLLIHLAKLRAREKDMEGAVPLFRRAIEEAASQGDQATVAIGLHEMGYGFLLKGQLDRAEPALVEAFRLRKMTRSRDICFSYQCLGMLRMSQGDLDSASHLLDAAVETAKSSHSLAPGLYAHYHRGRLRMLQDRPLEALADFRKSMDVARAWRAEVLPADSVRITSEVGLDELYLAFIGAAWKLYSPAGPADLAREAFQAAEENRAASLRALLAESAQEKLPAGHGEALAQLHRAEIKALTDNTSAVRAEIRRLRAKLIDMETQAGLDALSGSEPEPPAPADLLKRIQKSLGEHDALVTFHLGEEESYRWTVTKRVFSFDRLPGESRIAADVERFSSAVRNKVPDAVRQGELLYAELFGGTRLLESKTNWVLALDDALFQLPFAALPVGRRGGRPVYLVERHTTRVIPTVLLRVSAARPWSTGPFVGVGDPVYNTADPRWSGKGLQTDSIQMARLVGSGREVEACARIWSSPGTPAMLLTGKDASEGRLAQALERNPSVIHFAVHVLGSPRRPMQRFDETKPSQSFAQSFLALSLLPSGDPELLSPTRISGWRVRTGLVVLSGCSSASADVLPATGLMGLTRAWLVAGAEAVAASHWETPDSNGEIFRSFYRHLRGADPAVALQMAQLDMLRSNAWYAAPSYWAAYFVVGRN